MEEIQKVIQSVYERLCSFIPHRPDLHDKMFEEFKSIGVDWSIQSKIIEWVEKLQAPIYDQVTQQWKKYLPQELDVFVKRLQEHLDNIERGIRKHRDNLFASASGRCKWVQSLPHGLDWKIHSIIPLLISLIHLMNF